MKRLLIIPAVSALVITGCGGGNKNMTADSDSIYPDMTSETVETVVPVASSYITKDSIGHIFIGMTCHEVPDSVAGLYNHKENGASEDAVTITFSNPDGEQFISYDFGEGNIDVLNVIGRDIKVKAPDGDFGLGDKFTRVLDLPDVKTEWSGYDGGGSWYWVWDGLWFAPSQETLTDSISRRLYNYDTAPIRSDFTDDITIGFIGTGLPF